MPNKNPADPFVARAPHGRLILGVVRALRARDNGAADKHPHGCLARSVAQPRGSSRLQAKKSVAFSPCAACPLPRYFALRISGVFGLRSLLISMAAVLALALAARAVAHGTNHQLVTPIFISGNSQPIEEFSMKKT